MTQLSVITCLLILVSCAGPTISDEKSVANNSQLLLENTVTHVFSNPQQPDQFRVQLIGHDIISASIRLSIVTAAGDTIWNDSFPATALLTEEEKLATAVPAAFIQWRINTFFEADNFANQAIAKEAIFDPELNGNQQQWQEIKQQRRPGFLYVIGDEEGHTLSYSALLGKAVNVDSCC